MLDWIPLDSSVISAAAYKDGSLYIRFVTSHIYEYYHVSKRVYDQLIKSPSAGQYFAKNIKDHYDFSKMTDKNGRR